MSVSVARRQTKRSGAGWLLLASLAGCSGAPAPNATPGSAPSAAVPLAIRNEQHVMVEGKLPAGATPSNPFAGDSAAAREGAKLFTTMNCDGCHGGGATGFIAPSLSDGRWRYGGSDGSVYQTIFYGRPQGMPAFGGVVQEATIWKLVTYIRGLPVPKAVPTQSW